MPISIFSKIDNPSYILLFAYGLLNVLTTFLLIKGFSSVKFSIGNLILLSEVVFGLIFGYIFLGQTVTPYAFVGILIVIMVLLLIRVVEYRGQSK